VRVLITNDDSHRSPLLKVAVDYFAAIAEVTLVVPLHEQSWTGKSMTRFNPVHVEAAELFGRPATFVSGTPADCVNLALHNLMPSKPDLVVSGINAGYNIGVGFVLSSGTVGACLEANIAGVPAVAISQAFDSATRNAYMAEYLIEPARAAVFREQAHRVLDHVVGRLLAEPQRSETLGHPITWNVNLPFSLTDPAVVRPVHLGLARYGRVFHEEDEATSGGRRTFRHSAIEKVPDPSAGCDSAVLDSGCATITPIDLWSFAGAPHAAATERLLQRLTR